MAVGDSLPSSNLGQTKHVPMLKPGRCDHQLKISKSGSDGTTTACAEQHTSTATTSGVASDSLKNTVAEPSQDGFYSQAPNVAPPDKIHLQDRPTLAQRRAERQFAHAQINFSQAAARTAKLPPASLRLAPDPRNSNKINPLRFATIAGLESSRPHTISHSQFSTWKRLSNSDSDNPIHPELANWVKVEQDLLRLGLIKRFPGQADGGSFAVPNNFEQWLEFRAGRTEDLLLEGAAKIHSKSSELATKACQRLPTDNPQCSLFDSHSHRKNVRIGLAMGGKEYHDGLSLVLAQPTTWSRWYQPTEDRPQALWPCTEEMKEEGDERHTSAFGRFLALPRVPGNDTVVWKQKQVLPALPFDQVWKVPNKETWADLHGQKPHDSQEEYMKGVVGQALLEAIDC